MTNPSYSSADFTDSFSQEGFNYEVPYQDEQSSHSYQYQQFDTDHASQGYNAAKDKRWNPSVNSIKRALSLFSKKSSSISSKFVSKLNSLSGLSISKYSNTNDAELDTEKLKNTDVIVDTQFRSTANEYSGDENDPNRIIDDSYIHNDSMQGR